MAEIWEIGVASRVITVPENSINWEGPGEVFWVVRTSRERRASSGNYKACRRRRGYRPSFLFDPFTCENEDDRTRSPLSAPSSGALLGE